MKQTTLLKGIAALLLVFALVGCTPTSKQVTSTTVTGDNLRVADIDLPGMFCAACAQSSESAFEGIPGVVQATVDIKTKTGTVIYDPAKIAKEQLIQDGLIKAYGGKILDDQAYHP